MSMTSQKILWTSFLAGFCYLAQLCADARLRPGDDVEQVRKRTFKQAEMAPTQPICKKWQDLQM